MKADSSSDLYPRELIKDSQAHHGSSIEKTKATTAY
jgi:hypothetical protein